jgi:hypothetical protein
MMKTALLAALAGSTLTFALGAYTEEAITQVVTGPLDITVHDMAGRTFQVNTSYNSWNYNNNVLTVDYTSDQFLCSGFEQ